MSEPDDGHVSDAPGSELPAPKEFEGFNYPEGPEKAAEAKELAEAEANISTFPQRWPSLGNASHPKTAHKASHVPPGTPMC